MPKQREKSPICEQELQGRLLMSANQSAKLIGISVSTWWEWARTFPDFPKSIRIGNRCTRWDKSEVVAWLDARRTD